MGSGQAARSVGRQRTTASYIRGRCSAVWSCADNAVHAALRLPPGRSVRKRRSKEGRESTSHI
jgi:hypothetical protein